MFSRNLSTKSDAPTPQVNFSHYPKSSNLIIPSGDIWRPPTCAGIVPAAVLTALVVQIHLAWEATLSSTFEVSVSCLSCWIQYMRHRRRTSKRYSNLFQHQFHPRLCQLWGIPKEPPLVGAIASARAATCFRAGNQWGGMGMARQSWRDWSSTGFKTADLTNTIITKLTIRGCGCCECSAVGGLPGSTLQPGVAPHLAVSRDDTGGVSGTGPGNVWDHKLLYPAWGNCR